MTEAKVDSAVNFGGKKETAATIPQEEILIPVKFNKQIKNITAAKAAELAQKGMKYEIIEKDYEALKALALESGKSVAEFLEGLKSERLENRKSELTQRCGGDRALAEQFLQLEQAVKKETEIDLTEVKMYFPDITEQEDLPDEVLENSRLKGTRLLDEYLRYLLAEKMRQKAAEAEIKNADRRSMGSLQNKNGVTSPEAMEFLKGLWK